MHRRRYIRSLGAVGFASTLVLSGCLGSDESDDDGDDEDDDGTDDGELASGSDPAAAIGEDNGNDSPRVHFDVEYEAGTPISDPGAIGILEITHTSGDTVDASNLFVRGENIYPRADGRWDQQFTDTEGEVQPPAEGEVRSGVSVFVDAREAYDLDVVWVGPNGATAKLHAGEADTDARGRTH